MKLGCACLAVVLTVVAPTVATAQTLQRAQPSPGSVAADVPGELIVQFDSGVSAGARGSARRAADVDVLHAMVRSGQQLLQVQPGQTVDDAVHALERDPRVAYAQANHVYHASAVPNDPLFGQLWGQLNSGQTLRGVPGLAGIPGDDSDATVAWNRTVGSRGVVVAVTDTGVAYDHPDLAANLWVNPGEVPANGADDDRNGFADDVRGWDFCGSPLGPSNPCAGPQDNDPRDLNEHGTHVAGTIGAVGNNSRGVAGMSWQVSLMPVRVLNADGHGSSQSVADGFNYAGANGARVVNASLGGDPDPGDLAVNQAMMSHRNTLYVVAAGNGGEDGVGDDNDAFPQNPCALDAPNLVCVAATTQSDRLASFSNYGATTVDLGAPGTNILSTVPSSAFHDEFETGLGKWAATPWQLVSTASSGGAFSVTDSPGGTYAPNANTILQTAAKMPMSGEGCHVSYDLRLDSEPLQQQVGTLVLEDGLIVEFSRNGTTWIEADGWAGHTGGEFYSLSSQLPSGQDVFIRFRFVSDGDATVFDGAYLDNIRAGCLADNSVPAYDGSEYAFLDGTSMATPQVAGAAALALALKPGTTVSALKGALLSSGDPLPALAGKTVTGRRLNVASLLNSIDLPVTSTPTPTPTAPPVTSTPTPTPTAPPTPTPTAPPPPRPKTLADVKVSRCKQSGSGKRRQLKCALRNATVVLSARLTLKKGRTTIAKGTLRPKGRTLALKLKHKLRKGRYTLSLVLRDAAGHTRKIAFRFHVT
jgi:thermitase